MIDDKLWLGKKVFVSIKNSSRKYSGKVIVEDETSITIIDITGKQVQITKDSTEFIQEEK